MRVLRFRRNLCLFAWLFFPSYSCLATFDAKDMVYFEDLPALPEFTMCQWIILDDTWTGTKNFFLHQMYGKSHIVSILTKQDLDQIVFLMLIKQDAEEPEDHQE